MESIKNNKITGKKRTLTVGICTVLGVILLGVGISFFAGFTAPAPSHADDSDFTMSGGTTPDIGDDSFGSDYGSDFGSIFGTTPDIGDDSYDSGIDTTIGTTPDIGDDEPCCTIPETTPATITTPDIGDDEPCCTLPAPVVTPEVNTTPDIGDDEPCCTLPAPVIAPDTGTTPDIGDDEPCCTLPTPTDTYIPPVIETTPIVDVYVPPTVPPVVPPVTPPVTPPTPAQCIYLAADKTTITPGEAVTLSYKTQDATSISIDQGVGLQASVAQGSVVVHPTGNTTYTATVTGATNSVNCTASVVVVPPPVITGASCTTLTADKTVITPGETVTLTWATNNASAISIDNGVGNVSPVAGGSVNVTPTGDTTYTATVPGAAFNPACQVQVRIQTPTCSDTNTCGGGGGGGNGGGGSGGGYSSGGGGGSGQIVPSTYVYLSQIPYTGLDLGPVGTVIYWVLLVLWCAAAAYLALFIVIPFVYRRLMSFGANMEHVLNQAPTMAHAGVSAASHAVSSVTHAVSEAAHGHDSHAATSSVAAPAPHGFAAYATPGAALTIDDIVKGLSRNTPAAPAQAEESHDMVPVGAAHDVAHFTQEETAAAAPAPVAQPAAQPARTAPKANDVAPDVRDFIGALMQGDRNAVFGAIRQTVREGGDAEAFLTQVVCALDDAYRGPMEGTPVHPAIAQLTSGAAPAFLERLISSLTNAVDSSYSAGITGAKLAATRALAVVEG